MIEIGYNFDASWNSKTRETDLATADDSALRYELLLGDITFQADGCSFNAQWGWVPVIDFAASLQYIVRKLLENASAKEVFEFTESEDTLVFERDRDMVAISASYVSCHARVPLTEFVAAIDELSRRIKAEISRDYPSIMQNKVFNQTLPEP